MFCKCLQVIFLHVYLDTTSYNLLVDATLGNTELVFSIENGLFPTFLWGLFI